MSAGRAILLGFCIGIGLWLAGWLIARLAS